MKRLACLVIAGLAASLAHLVQPAAQTEEERTLLHATLMIQRAETQARAIADLTSVPGLEVLELSELPREDASNDLLDSSVDRFTTRYLYEIAQLREAMDDNPVVSDALAEAGVELSRVVAAEINPDLTLTVYIDDT